MNNYKVLVLLSSYNGEKYIREQISSILNQDGVDVHLLIRDDGSTDNTCSIIESFEEPKITLLRRKNIGCIDSFSSLVKEAYKLTKEYDYFAFSDQDDIWHLKKMATGVKVLSEQNDDSIPLLYACNMNIVDAENHFIKKCHQSDLTMRKGALLIDSRIPGCGMVFNREAVKLYSSNPPKGGMYHDHWMTLMCLYLGKVIYDPVPYINYRQHANNVLGAHHFLMSSHERLKKKIKEFVKTPESIPHNYKEVSAFLACFNSKLADKDILIIKNYLNYNKSFKSRIYFSFHKTYFPTERGSGFYKHVFLHIVRSLLNRI